MRRVYGYPGDGINGIMGAFGRAEGMAGVRVERPQDIGPAWERALAAEKPTVVEMVTDPNVPPLPPHITFEQAKAYLSALIKRDPDSVRMVTASGQRMVGRREAPASPEACPLRRSS